MLWVYRPICFFPKAEVGEWRPATEALIDSLGNVSAHQAHSVSAARAEVSIAVELLAQVCFAFFARKRRE